MAKATKLGSRLLAAFKARKRILKKRWYHEGGSCAVSGPCVQKRFRCDDGYIDWKTGRWVIFDTTQERHFNIPLDVESLREIRHLTGVDKMREADPKGRASRIDSRWKELDES